MKSSWALWYIWQISHLVTEMRDCVEGCPKWWNRSWGITARGSHLDFEVQSEMDCRWNWTESLAGGTAQKQQQTWESDNTVRHSSHWGGSPQNGLVERPWLQLMCCAICLPRGRNFRWRRKSPSGSEYWLVCHHWTPEIEFNKRLSSLIIRLVNYSVTTSLIYKLIL